MRIGGHVAKRKRLRRLAVDGVHVAVLVPPDVVHHEVPHPSLRKRLARDGEREFDLIARMHDDQMIIARGQQRQHVAEPGECAGDRRPHVAGDEVLIVEEFRAVPRGRPGAQRDSAAVTQIRRDERQFHLPHLNGPVIHSEERRIPIELHVRDDPQPVVGRVGCEDIGNVHRDRLGLAAGEAHEGTDFAPSALRINGVQRGGSRLRLIWILRMLDTQRRASGIHPAGQEQRHDRRLRRWLCDVIPSLTLRVGIAWQRVVERPRPCPQIQFQIVLRRQSLGDLPIVRLGVDPVARDHLFEDIAPLRVLRRHRPMRFGDSVDLVLSQ